LIPSRWVRRWSAAVGSTRGVIRGSLSAGPRLFADRFPRAGAMAGIVEEPRCLRPRWRGGRIGQTRTLTNAFCYGGVGERFRRWNLLGRAAHDWIPVVSPVRGQPSTANTDETPLHHVRRNRPQSSDSSTAADARPPRGRQGSAAPPSPQQPTPGCRWLDGIVCVDRENAPAGGECFRCLLASTSAKELS
jgi:hypothetical protein